MKYAEKLYKQMLLKGLNQQRLAKESKVSDSEVSRILGGKSQPGLENAFQLARAVGVSLDFLADDSLDADPLHQSDPGNPSEADILRLARELGLAPTQRLLEIARVLGNDSALRRLIGADSKAPSEATEAHPHSPDAPSPNGNRTNRVTERSISNPSKS
jgi:transcriptional regulator with XRE-family HTH domain